MDRNRNSVVKAPVGGTGDLGKGSWYKPIRDITRKILPKKRDSQPLIPDPSNAVVESRKGY